MIIKAGRLNIGVKTNKMNKTIIAVGLISLMLLSVVIAAESNASNSNLSELEKEEVKKLREDVKELRETVSEIREVRNNLILEINPEKSQVLAGEKALFIVTIKDLHKISKLGCVDDGNKGKCLSVYTYKLSTGGDNVNLKLEFSEVVLSAGEKKQIRLSASSNEAGEHIFSVKAEGNGAAQKARGMLIVSSSNENPVIVDSSFFMGQGFLLNQNGDKGELVDLKVLLKENVLSGKMRVSDKTYQIKGDLSGENVTFQILETNSGELRGNFSGSYKKFASFILLRGSLTIDGEAYSLTAMSENKLVFKDIEIKEKKENTIMRKGEVIVVNKYEDEEGNETYFKPVRIEKEKILGIIPNPWGDKVLRVEVTENGKVSEVKIKEKEEREFKEYRVRANNLEDENNIDLDITKK